MQLAVTYSGGSTQRVVYCFASFIYVTFNAFRTAHFVLRFTCNVSSWVGERLLDREMEGIESLFRQIAGRGQLFRDAQGIPYY